MADGAVSIYGSYGTKHILAGTASTFGLRGHGLTFISALKRVCVIGKMVRVGAIVLYCLFSSACQSERVVQPHSSGLAQSQNWMNLLTEEISETAAPKPVEFPDDLNAHPQSQAESFVLQAFVRTNDDKQYSVQVQIDRLNLKRNRAEFSQWSFTDVMRASLTLGESGAPHPQQRESISRVALGLAKANARTLQVEDVQLDIKPSEGCDAKFTVVGKLQDGTEVSLEWRLTDCPETLLLGSLNQWTAAFASVSGQLAGETAAQQLIGWGSVQHRYGQLPSAEGAVVFDEASVHLDDKWLLVVSRSKRRSGRGPQTVVATLSDISQQRQSTSSPRTIDVQWVDEGTRQSDASGIPYPEFIRLISEESGISIQLVPIVGMPEIIDRLGARWDAGVIVSGSHKGDGFVHFKPLLN
ncbi:MAG: lipocalin family protein [Granulosicoccus sp.]